MMGLSMNNRPSLRSAQILSGAALIFIFAACSDDPKPDGRNDYIPGVNQVTNQGGEADADDDGIDDVDDAIDDVDPGGEQDADLDAGADDVDDGEDDTGPEPDPQDNVCGEVIDLGTIGGSYQESFTVKFSDFDDRFRTICDESEDGRAEIVFQYELAGEGRLSVDSSFDAILELRADHCVDFQALECAVGAIDGYLGWSTRYLLVEKLNEDDPDEIEITITFDEFEGCDLEELGQARCLDEDRIEACDVTFGSPDIPFWLEFECPMGCEDDRCHGDSCQAPIVVTDQIAFTAYQHVLSNQHNSLGADACGPDGEAGEDLEGRELVFELPDLSTEQEVVVQASYNGLYVGQEISLLFKDGCQDQLACLDFHQGEEAYTFSPPADGTYYLFVDLPMDFDGETIIEIEIQDK